MRRAETTRLKSNFAGIEKVVADPLRFKLMLGIGEDAYASLWLKKHLQTLWDAGGMAATGAAVAASPVVATTFFAPTGLMALIGLGTAATPIGWVAAAAIGSAGAYFGVTRLYDRYAGSQVDVIPKFIGTPLDLLGATLLDMIGALAVRLAQIDGKIDDSEIKVIAGHFVEEWGFDPGYVKAAIQVLIANAGSVGVKELALELATFQAQNPDCSATAMRSQLIAFLREVMAADGVLDEREQLAIDGIAQAMEIGTAQRLRLTRRRLTDMAENVASKLTSVVRPKAAKGD